MAEVQRRNMAGRGWQWKKAAKKLLAKASLCGRGRQKLKLQVVDNNLNPLQVAGGGDCWPETQRRSISSDNKNLCAICLDPLISTRHAIFTAQCGHSFHFTCISSNVGHGSVTCPICRDRWTELPRRRDESIAQDDDDDDVDDDDDIPDGVVDQPFVRISPLIASVSHRGSGFGNSMELMEESASLEPQHLTFTCFRASGSTGGCLKVKLDRQPATDLVLVASPSGPHVQLMKRPMVLVIFSMRPLDRLAIVTNEGGIFPLSRMDSDRRREALELLDRLLYIGHADPMHGLHKGVKILEDRVHRNPRSCILHLTDSPSGSYPRLDPLAPFAIHRFDVGLGFGTSNRFMMHLFAEFLATRVRGTIRDIQLRVGEGTRIVRIGRMRAGEERYVPIYVDESRRISIEYSYIDGGGGECLRTGEVVVGMENGGPSAALISRRMVRR